MKYSYNLRGTNGSGKTRVVRWLLEASNAKPCNWTSKGKIRAYSGDIAGFNLVILGSYESACGGCDTIDNVAEVAELLRLYMTDTGDPNVFMDAHPSNDRIVLFEGLMISHMLGTVGAMQAKLGKKNNVLAFLDTPLDKCIEHVMTRRMLRKDERPFDPKNVIKDHGSVQKCWANAKNQGYRTTKVHWQGSIETVLHDLKALNAGMALSGELV